MAKQTFVADAILTAAQMNALQGNDFNQTVSTKTASYTLVAADAGTKIVMNSASATTITVNTSLFAAGDTLTILNIAAGVCTVTAGTATVSTTGTLALVQNAGGTLYFTSAGVSVFQADGVTAAAGGLVRVGGGTVGTGASIQFTSVFSSTYSNYRIIGTGLLSSANANVTFVLDGIVTGYYAQRAFIDQGATAWTVDVPAVSAVNSGSTFNVINTFASSFQMEVANPNLAVAKQITYTAEGYAASNGQARLGFLQTPSTTQATGITFTLASGTFSSGRIDIYGYALS